MMFIRSLQLLDQLHAQIQHEANASIEPADTEEPASNARDLTSNERGFAVQVADYESWLHS